MGRPRRKAKSPSYDKDEHSGPESSDDSGDDQYDTDPTEPDCDEDQLKDAGDVIQLFADNEHPPEYYLEQLEQFDESVYTQEDYSKGSCMHPQRLPSRTVQVFATSTSRLLRTLQMEAGQKVIGYKICPLNPQVLYIFTSKLVTKWDWDSGKRLARWETDATATAVDVPLVESQQQIASYSILTHKDGKRQILINPLGDKKTPGIIALQTQEQINAIQVVYGGRFILASGGNRLFLGTTANVNFANPESISFKWREAALPVSATCFHLRESSTRSSKTSEAVDLVVGEKGGSILIYQDLSATLFGRNAEKSPPRKLHWHRSSVNTVRWSKDGNYILTGGQEPVMVLWQLDTGRNQFLPHLSSPACNIVVSPSGISYVVKLADNSVMVLSARELTPFASVTGLQLCSEGGSKDLSSKKSLGTTATLHPQHPEWLLVAVPASHQTEQPAPQRLNSAVLQTFDIRANHHVSRQALARTNTTTLNVSPEGSAILPPDVQHMDVAQDGKWLATVDTWTPHARDVEALARDSSKPDPASLRPEVFLKFWKWSASSSTWELVTRIDAPHFSEINHSTLLGLGARPYSHVFATVGGDAFVRFWCSAAPQRSGLKTDPAEQHQDTWKCRSFVDLKGYLDDETEPLRNACMSFSEDGSVLAVCLPSKSGANSGLVLLVDSRNGTVHYQRTGVFYGNPSSARFLGRYLIVASSGSVAVWDTVDDVVKPIQLSATADTTTSPLIAVNPRTQTVAVVVNSLDEISRAKRRRNRFQVRIYDVPSFEVVFQEALGGYPLTLLSDVYSGDYIVVDTTAKIQRLGCLEKASQKSIQPREVTSHLNSGLANIFSRGHESVPAQSVEGDASSSETKGLAGVFGETPSFSLPALGVLLRKVVQTLGSS